MATFTPDPQKYTTRAARAMGAYIALLNLESAERRAWADYIVARNMVREALATARQWRFPHWGHLEASDRRARFHGHLKWAEDALCHAQAMLWHWQQLNDARACLPHHSFEDCVTGLSAEELEDAVDVLWHWQMGANHDDRRDRMLHDAALKCRLRIQALEQAPSPTDYIKGMNAALALGPAAE